jgi:hypothetical protein
MGSGLYRPDGSLETFKISCGYFKVVDIIIVYVGVSVGVGVDIGVHPWEPCI